MFSAAKYMLKQVPPLRALVRGSRQLTGTVQDGVRRIVARTELIKRLTAELNHVHGENSRLWRDRELVWVTPGHFYSPLSSREELAAYEKHAAEPKPRELPGIDLNESGQLALLDKLTTYYKEMPFGVDDHPEGLRYRLHNKAFYFTDGVFYYSMLRHLKPPRVLEVGSGWSSALLLDVDERFLGGRTQCTFVEPYPDLLHSLVRPEDAKKHRIIPKKLQDVDLSEFTSLESGDLLFIDSSHVCKPLSDVEHLFNHVLPAVKPGVHIHIHDIFYPFEYINVFVQEMRAWNELYVLRSFLQYNDHFKIELFNHHLQAFHNDRLMRDMPLCLSEGSSIWLRRV